MFLQDARCKGDALPPQAAVGRDAAPPAADDKDLRRAGDAGQFQAAVGCGIDAGGQFVELGDIVLRKHFLRRADFLNAVVVDTDHQVRHPLG